MQEVIDDSAELLPDEVLAMEQDKKLRILEKLEAFGTALAKKRQQAITGRSNSGIEQDWAEDLDSYNGLDDANRTDKNWEKPVSLNGVLTQGIPQRGNGVRSTVFMNITRPYVDAAAAKIADMLLPTDDRNWSIKPTPIPELDGVIKNALGQAPIGQAMNGQQPGAPNMGQMSPGMGMPVNAGAMGGNAAINGQMQPQQPNIDPQVQQAQQILKDAAQRAEKAQTQIEDWLIECQYHAEIRKVIEDSAKLGSGILKGPFPEKRKKTQFKQDQGMAMLEVIEEIKPSCRRIDPQNFYPDPACGEDIANGNYVWERDYITARQLKELVGVPGYVDSQIAAVIEEGPQKKHADGSKQFTNEDERYEIWYFTGFAEREDLECAGVEVPEGQVPTIPAVITMVNDRVIKGALNPFDTGDFPYHVFPWQRRPDMPWGMGVARQVRTPQRMLNAGTRNMMDNAGLSAGPQVVLRRGAVEPADGQWSLTPRKIWYVKNDADVQSVQNAFSIFSIETRQAELMNIIQFSMKMAEDITGLPMILQGQQGQAPDTVGGMQLLANNASSVLRRLARTFDDTITEPFIRSMYNWLMMYSDDDSIKGDYIIDARGSTSLVERDIQNTEIAQMGQLVLNPAFGLSPDKWIKEYLRSRRFDPAKFEMSDEEKQALAQQQQPVAPQVQAAQIRAETDLKKTEMQANMQMQKIKVDTDRDRAYVEAETQRTTNEFQSRREELMVRRELEMLRYANQQKVTLDQIKSDMAQTAAKLRVQKELSALGHTVAMKKHVTPQAMTPPTEPAGRAPNGQAFQQ